MISIYEVIKAIMRTEKSARFEDAGKYLFLVNNNSNKAQIKEAVEKIYKVKVKTVNTLVRRGKLKKVRQHVGKLPDTKKAMVTLKAGNKIEVS